MRARLRSILSTLAMAFALLGGVAKADAGQLKVLFFATPWCVYCHQYLPELQKLVDDRLSDQLDRFSVQVLIETGDSSSSRPTQEAADAYQTELGIRFPVSPDSWRWKTFRKYFPDEDLAIPASVVLDGDETVLKAFPPGSFEPKELVDFIEGALGNRH